MKAAFLPTGVTAGIIVIIVLAVLLTGDGDFTGAFAAVGAGWLAIHQISLPISGVRLGVLPILATAAIFAASYHQCKKVARGGLEPRDAAQLAAAVVGVPLVMTIIALAVVKDASTVLKIATPNFFQAFAWTIGIHGIAAAFALGRSFWQPYAELLRIPDWGWDALRAARRGGVTLAAAGLAATLALLAASLDDIVAMLEAHHGAAAPLGLTALSLLYLANVVVGVVGVSTGAAITIGEGYISLFGFVPAPVPTVPVLAALPVSGPEPWWPLLMLIPVAAGVSIGQFLHSAALPARQAFSAAACAAVVASAGYSLLAVAAGGALGVFGSVTLAPLYGGLFLCGWLLLSSSAALGLLLWMSRRKDRHERRAEVERAIAEALAEEQAREQATAEKPESDGAGPDTSETAQKSGLLALVRQRVPAVPVSVTAIPGAVSKLRKNLPGASKPDKPEPEVDASSAGEEVSAPAQAAPEADDSGNSATDSAAAKSPDNDDDAVGESGDGKADSAHEGGNESDPQDVPASHGQQKWKIWRRKKDH